MPDMIMDDQPYTFDRVVRMTLMVGVIVGLLWVFRLLSPVLIPFAVALLLAYFIHPLVNLVQKRIPNRIASTLICVCGLGMTAILAAWLLMRLVVGEIVRFAGILGDLAAEKEVYQRLAALIPQEAVDEIRRVAGDWSQLQNHVSGEQVWNVVTKVAPVPLQLIQQVGGFLGAGLGLSVIVMYLIFLLIDFDWFQSRWQNIIPEPQRPGVIAFLGEWNVAMGRHFRAQAMVAGSVGLLMAVGFWFVGLPMGILFGLFVGLLNMVPYMQLASIPVAAVLALMQWAQGDASLWWALGGTAGVYLVVQLIQDALLVPKFMGDALGLRPVIILLAIMIWGQLLGMLGLLLALPLTCLGWAWYARWVLEPAKKRVAQANAAIESA